MAAKAYNALEWDFKRLKRAVKSLKDEQQIDLSALPPPLYPYAMGCHLEKLASTGRCFRIYVQNVEESLPKTVDHTYDPQICEEIQKMAASLPGLKKTVTDFQHHVQSQLAMLPNVDSQGALEKHQLSLGRRPNLSPITPILQKYRCSENSDERKVVSEEAYVMAYNIFKAQAIWDGKGINEHSLACMAEQEIDHRFG
jgi:hypothetical protein